MGWKDDGKKMKKVTGERNGCFALLKKSCEEPSHNRSISIIKINDFL